MWHGLHCHLYSTDVCTTNTHRPATRSPLQGVQAAPELQVMMSAWGESLEREAPQQS